MRIHLEGLGLMGSLLIPHLVDDGHEVTWDDTEEVRVQSWRASTGAIMPFGDDDSMQGLRLWIRMIRTPSTFRELYRRLTERATFCYYSQNPPHGGKAYGVEEVAKVGGVRVSNQYSYHIDAQQVVQVARSHFRGMRAREWKKTKPDLRIVTHGWRPEVIGAYSWGWSAMVQAYVSNEVQEALRTKTGCFYMRNGYQIAYLYPVGRTGMHYAGTTLITQKGGPKNNDPQPHFERWQKQIEEFSEGHLRGDLLYPATLQQAWRPKPKDEQVDMVWQEGRTIFLRPAYGNGIRMFPLYLQHLREHLADVA